MGKRKLVHLEGPSSSSKSSKGGSSLQVEQKSPIAEEEKRALKKGNVTNSIRQRIYRANSQRMYLINQMDMTNNTSSGNENDVDNDNKVNNITTIDETKLLCRKFTILGSTGNVYDVLINRFPSCNCPDFGRSHLCKHILFVLLKVLHVPIESNLLYQRALLQSELKEIFCGLQTNDLGRVLAKQEVIRAYNNKSSGKTDDLSSNDEAGDDQNTIREPEGECAICFEPMISNTTSNAVKGNVESLDSCRTCHNYLHTDCLKQWLKQSNSCVYCRSQWSDKISSSSSRSGGTMEGYVNLSSIQGMSSRRDTSTYHDYTLERMFHDHDDD